MQHGAASHAWALARGHGRCVVAHASSESPCGATIAHGLCRAARHRQSISASVALHSRRRQVEPCRPGRRGHRPHARHHVRDDAGGRGSASSWRPVCGDCAPRLRPGSGGAGNRCSRRRHPAAQRSAQRHGAMMTRRWSVRGHARIAGPAFSRTSTQGRQRELARSWLDVAAAPVAVDREVVHPPPLRGSGAAPQPREWGDAEPRAPLEIRWHLYWHVARAVTPTRAGYVSVTLGAGSGTASVRHAAGFDCHGAPPADGIVFANRSTARTPPSHRPEDQERHHGRAP